ncbi:MAG: glycosyltransferase family 39 protein [Actinomadura sp.]
MSAATAALGAGLVVAWLCVMLPNLRMLPPQDQLNYLQAAANFPDGLTDPDAPPGADVTHQVLRFGLILPTRLAIEVFGYSQAAYYAVPLLAVVLLLVSLYALGALLFARAVGVAAAALVLSTTPVFREQSYLMPDLLTAALFTAAVTLCVAVRLRRLPRRWPVFVLIGVLLGWGYLVREFVVFGWPLVPVLLWRGGWRSTARDLLWVAAPMAALWLAETALCWGLYGDPLLRLKTIAGHGSAPSAPGFAETYRDKTLSVYVLRLPEALRRYTEGHWLLGLLGLTIVGGTVQALGRLGRLRDPATRILRGPAGQGVALLLLWCALIWVPLTLLGGVLDPAAPKLRLQLIRYWFPIFPAFVLGGLAVVWLLGRRLLGRLPAWRGAHAVAGVLVLLVAAVPARMSVHNLWGVTNTRTGGATHMEAFRDWMGRYEETPDGRAVRAVWTDTSTDGILRVFRTGPFGGRAWSAQVRSWRPGGPAPGTGDLLLTYSLTGGRCVYCQRAMQKLLADHPPRLGGAPLFATPDGQLQVFRVLGPST